MNLLIVDDDELLIKKIIEGTQWESIGIDTVLEANNIRKARSILEKFPIHILLTDIEMPQGSGLELLEWIRSENIPVECIVLSSYAYFAYAQKAMQLRTQEYLLKPVKNSELIEVIERVAAKTRSGRDSETELLQNKKSEFWKKYISEEQFSFAATEFYKQYENSQFSIVIISVQPDADIKVAKNISGIHFIIKNRSTEYFTEQNYGLEAVIRQSDYEWILIFEVKDRFSNIREVLIDFKQCLKADLHLDSFVYAGRECSLNKLELSWNNLVQMLREGIMKEDGILFEDDWRIQEKPYETLPWKVWEWEMLHSEKLADLEKELISTVLQLVDNNEAKKETFLRFRKDLFLLIHLFLNQIGVESKHIFGNKEFDHYYELSAKSITGMTDYIRYVFDKLFGFLNINKRNASPVDQIKEYIQNNLKEDLSRSHLAKQVFLSEDYISKIFMKEVGMSLTAYITEARMKKAKEYLRYNNATVSEIAVSVGYSNFSYFSKSFKDYYGYTPNEFKTNKEL